MHIEFLVEDRSGKEALQLLLPKIISSSEHSYRVISYRGIGELPKDLRTTQDPRKRILLHQLPRLLQGYGRTPGIDAVVVVVDSDRRPCAEFLSELQALLRNCHPVPRTLFRLAIEELEAWLLGDPTAVLQAYPAARRKILDGYEPDSICGTWEALADCVHVGGSVSLVREGYSAAGRAKAEWASRIAANIDPDRNASPSFQKFVSGVRRLIRGG